MSPWGSFLQIHYLEHCPITAYVIATDTFIGSPFSLVCIDCEESPSVVLYYKYGEKSVFVSTFACVWKGKRNEILFIIFMSTLFRFCLCSFK